MERTLTKKALLKKSEGVKWGFSGRRFCPSAAAGASHLPEKGLGMGIGPGLRLHQRFLTQSFLPVAVTDSHSEVVFFMESCCAFVAQSSR